MVTSGSDVLWEPPADVRERTRVGAFLAWLSQARGLSFADYHELHTWSVTDLDGFWSAIWEFFSLGSDPGPALTSATMPGTQWFPHARLNWAEQVLRAPGLADNDPVVVAHSQTRPSDTLSVADLRDRVARAATGLRRLGVGPGDRVAAYLPNIAETFILLLASASLGAVFSSCAPEFGTRSVCDRLRQIEPKLLVTVDGYRYGDKDIDRRDEVATIREQLPSLEHVVCVPYLDPSAELPETLSWQAFLSTADPLEFARLRFDHPLYVLYSSGTTGLPKPIIHGHGGILLEHLKSLALHVDLGPGDRFWWFTTTGWMMWNYLVSAPATGAAIVLYDGDPGHPDLGAVWRLVDQTGTTVFGTSAPYLMACRKAGVVPRDIADLSRLRGLGSTGAPLPPEGFRWVYENVSTDVLLSSFSGGTDVCTGFVGASPLLPVYEGEIPAACLGCAIEAYDPTGRPRRGELGELVITAPMPSMPIGFWGDDGSRMREAYFSGFDGVWQHGDWITITERGSCVITGRSDATLNRGGVRLGTAEFYSVVEALPEIASALVVHLEGEGSGELVLFVALADGSLEVSDELRERIADELRSHLSPRHVPDRVHAVPAIPRTLSGKKLEVPVKRILLGTPIDTAAATGALADPESLAPFAALAPTDRMGP